MKSKPSHQGTQPGVATLGAQAPALPRAPPARLKMGRGSLWAGFWGRNGHFADFTAAWQSHPFSRRKDFVTRRALRRIRRDSTLDVLPPLDKVGFVSKTSS